MASSGPGLTLINGKDITLGKLLGQGGFGAVYKARHVNWGDVAVKRLKGVILTADVQKEADRMLRVVSSPYLIRIMGLIKNPGDVGIVMEFFENGSLKDFEKNYMKCDCWARKVKMVQDIAFGMNYLHTLNPPIIHRDLKLENVFVGSGFEAKIGDLGLAVSSMTSRRYAHVSGTRSHIPPEASNPEATEPDEFWDIYTFAITTYELVSGRDAWPQQQQFANDALIALWVLKGHRPKLEVIPPEAPSELVDVIQMCWVAEPKERPSFKDILNSVTELFETKFKHRLRKADRAIFEQMDLLEADEASVQQSGSSATDSGIGSDFWGSLEATSVKDCDNTITSWDTATETESASGNTATATESANRDTTTATESTSGDTATATESANRNTTTATESASGDTATATESANRDTTTATESASGDTTTATATESTSGNTATATESANRDTTTATESTSGDTATATESANRDTTTATESTSGDTATESANGDTMTSPRAVDKSSMEIRAYFHESKRLLFHPKCGINAEVIYNGWAAHRLNPLEALSDAVVLSNRPLAEGEMFEIRIDRMVDQWAGSIEIGVTTHSPRYLDFPRTMTFVKSGTWMLSGESVLHNGTIIEDKYCQDLCKLKVGDRIGVLRRNNGNLHFFINGVDQGIAATLVPQQLYAVVDLYGNTVEATIVDLLQKRHGKDKNAETLQKRHGKGQTGCTSH
ncbi:uncharacterized protein [Amphiura filiformis]|uniref:uncharacterized protein isoform X2 n=1 Tax=Amphiura filiformis TaxID=82378 RepID=UPI003B223962